MRFMGVLPSGRAERPCPFDRMLAEANLSSGEYSKARARAHRVSRKSRVFRERGRLSACPARVPRRRVARRRSGGGALFAAFRETSAKVLA